MGSKENFVDKTILNTPKPNATSTVEKKKTRKKISPDVESSMLSINDLSRITEDSGNESNTACNLYEQRSLAENSLQRANKMVSGIPSKYFKSNSSNSTKAISIINNSTVNESDLLRAPMDSSTPRSSTGRASLSQSVAQLSYKITNTDIPIDNFVEEFQKAMTVASIGSTKNVDPMDSLIFKPAEEAASMMLADELSWRKQNEIPVSDDIFSERNFSGKTSIGEFFRQKSDTLSVFGAKSPSKSSNRIPLIGTDSVNTSTQDQTEELKKHKSLSISVIQKCLQSDDTPKKTTEYLMRQSYEPDISRYLLQKKMEQLSPSISKNSSDTSDPSDNELFKGIFDKENIDTLNIPNKDSQSIQRSGGSPTSRSSSRALTSLPDGKLPIESTAIELVWGCVKINKTVAQEFSLRNKSSKRLGIQMAVTGCDYKIRKDNRMDAELLSSTKLILHPYESKVIMVFFVPARVGKI